MKKTLLIIAVVFLFNACDEEEVQLSYEDQLAVDIAKIDDYLVKNNLTAQSLESGLHYIIEVEGTGNHPSIDSTVKVKYTGKLLDDEVFDSGTIETELSGVILGWRKGIPLFKEGGSGMLLIPSCMGYGINGSRSVPENAVLIFDIELLDVSN